MQFLIPAVVTQIFIPVSEFLIPIKISANESRNGNVPTNCRK